MARPLRIEFSGALYHVTARGDRCEDIYEDDADREAFLQLLGAVCQRYGWRCHAYCLMNNHYHLVIETLQPNLSRGMRQLNGGYTQAFNRRHGRVGHGLSQQSAAHPSSTAVRSGNDEHRHYRLGSWS
jgi:putative transposase